MSTRGRRNRSGIIIDYDTDSSDEGSIESEEGEIPQDGDQSQKPQPNLELQEKLGSLENVRLINFMCHDDFSIDFGPQVNFVIGRNGSGKSAIMAALMLGFGGRASNTSRGQSVAGFIKKGKDIAKVAIRICNYNGSPQYSYKYQEFGKSILIERTLRRTAAKPPPTPSQSKKPTKVPTSGATSTYALKNATTGKVVSHRREDLESLVAYFSIQIDNPVVLLTQEVSKHFLNSNKPKDKYDFFLRASNLKTLKRQILQTKSDIELALKTKTEKENILPEVKSEVKELEYKVKKLKSVSKWKEDIEIAKTQLIWSEVSAKDKILETKKKELEFEENKLEEIVESLSQHEVKKSGLKDNIEAINEKVKDKEKLVTEVNSKIRNINEKASGIKREREQKGSEIRQQQSKVRELKSELDQFEKAIQDVLKKRRNHEQLEQEKAARRERKEELRDRKRQIEEQLEEDFKFVIKQKQKITELKRKSEGLSSEKNNLIRSNNDLRRNIKDMKSSKQDKLHIFGQIFPKINAAIEAAHVRGEFIHKPIGPLGQYIQLTNTSCSNALQSCLKGLLRAYVCDNLDDTEKLSDIFKKVIGNQRPPQIITRKFRDDPFDVEQNKIHHHKYRSFVDLINVNDNNAFNVLIDKGGLETVAYIENNEEAMNVLLNMRTVPENCRMAYSSDGTQYYPSTHHSTFRKYPSEFNQHADLFSRDFSSQIREHEVMIEKNIGSIQEIERKLQEYESQIQAESIEIPARESNRTKMKTELTNVSDELTELENFEEPEPVQVTSLEEERDEIKAKLDEEQTALDALKEAYEEIQDRLKTIDDEYKKLMEEKKEHADDIRDLDEELKRKQVQLQKLDTTRDTKKRDTQTAVVNELRKRILLIEEDVNDLTQEALEKSDGQRVYCDKTADELKAEIRRKVDLVLESEAQVGNFEEINAAYEHANTRLTSVLNTIEHVTSSIGLFSETFHQRKQLYMVRRAKVTSMMQETFKRCLKQLGFTGEMIIDHSVGHKTPTGEIVKKSPTLELRINPRAGHIYSDTRSLSGGERSFSTVAFLLALWEGCNSPFKILDEVDVFMDMITRQVALDSLVQAASENKKQHIFLSPLPMIDDHLKIDNITIFQMPEPIRVNHTTPQEEEPMEEGYEEDSD